MSTVSSVEKSCFIMYRRELNGNRKTWSEFSMNLLLTDFRFILVYFFCPDKYYFRFLYWMWLIDNVNTGFAFSRCIKFLMSIRRMSVDVMYACNLNLNYSVWNFKISIDF